MLKSDDTGGHYSPSQRNNENVEEGKAKSRIGGLHDIRQSRLLMQKQQQLQAAAIAHQQHYIQHNSQ